MYVPLVTMSTEDDNKSLEQLKTGLKRNLKWNKYRSEMTDWAKTNNLNYIIDPTSNKSNLIDFLFCHLKMKIIDRLFQSQFVFFNYETSPWK